MAQNVSSAIPGSVAPAQYVVRYETSFPWNDPTRIPVKPHYLPGEADRPIGLEFQLSIPSNTLRIDCTLQPNPFVFAWFKPRGLLRPARVHLLAIMVLKRTEADPNDVPVWFLKQQLTRFGVAEHLARQGLIGRTDDPSVPFAFAQEMMPRTKIKVWKGTLQEFNRRQPPAAFATSTPGGTRLLVRSKRPNEAGFAVSIPACARQQEQASGLPTPDLLGNAPAGAISKMAAPYIGKKAPQSMGIGAILPPMGQVAVGTPVGTPVGHRTQADIQQAGAAFMRLTQPQKRNVIYTMAARAGWTPQERWEWSPLYAGWVYSWDASHSVTWNTLSEWFTTLSGRHVPALGTADGSDIPTSILSWMSEERLGAWGMPPSVSPRDIADAFYDGVYAATTPSPVVAGSGLPTPNLLVTSAGSVDDD